MQMTKTNHERNDGCKGNLLTKGKTSCGIEYELAAISDMEGVLIDAYLDIVTPAAFIVILQNLNDAQIDELIDKLNDVYSYNKGDCVSLKIPGSKYDCIFINNSVVEKHPLGYETTEQTVDGHEVEICDVLEDYISNIRTHCDPDEHDTYVGFSIVFDTEILPDDEGVNILELCDKITRDEGLTVNELELRIVGMEDNLLESELCVRRGFSYEDISFTFHHMRCEQKHMATGVAE